MFVCPHPKFLCWKRIPDVIVLGDGASGRWLGHEGWAFTNGLVPYKRDTRGSFFAAEDTAEKPSHLWPRTLVFTRHWICWRLDLELPSLWNWKKCLLFVSHTNEPRQHLRELTTIPCEPHNTRPPSNFPDWLKDAFSYWFLGILFVYIEIELTQTYLFQVYNMIWTTAIAQWLHNKSNEHHHT